MSKRTDEVREALAQAESAPAEKYETYHLQKATALALLGILECMERAEQRRRRAEDVADAASEKPWDSEQWRRTDEQH